TGGKLLSGGADVAAFSVKAAKHMGKWTVKPVGGIIGKKAYGKENRQCVFRKVHGGFPPMRKIGAECAGNSALLYHNRLVIGSFSVGMAQFFEFTKNSLLPAV